MTIQLLPKTNQEAFDMVVRHLATMPRRAMASDSYDDCVYYDPETGARCAIGGCAVLKTDEDKERASRIMGAVDDCLDNGEFRCSRAVDRSLLLKLQHAHDSSYNWLDEVAGKGYSNWALLRDLAGDFNLNSGVIEEARNAPTY